MPVSLPDPQAATTICAVLVGALRCGGTRRSPTAGFRAVRTLQ